MNRIFSPLAQYVFSDYFGFMFFELVLFLIFFYALYKDLTKNKAITIKRGEQSRNYFKSATSIVLIVAVSVVFTISKYPEEKVTLYFINIFSTRNCSNS